MDVRIEAVMDKSSARRVKRNSYLIRWVCRVITCITFNIRNMFRIETS